MLKASGVPRGFQRINVGKTRGGGGHAAVACYHFQKGKWLHYETTAKKEMIFDIKDNNENININDIWWSFDDTYSWSTNPANISKDYTKS